MNGRNVFLCPVSKKLQFNSSAAAKKSRDRARNDPFERAIRAYKCPSCDYWHNTSMTQAQYNERKARNEIEHNSLQSS